MIKPKLKTGLIQLDSRYIVNPEGGLSPEYPSIILGESIAFTGNQGEYEPGDVIYRGTELLSFMKLYDPNFETAIKTLYNEADNSPDNETYRTGFYTFTFKGYRQIDTDPNSSTYGQMIYPDELTGRMEIKLGFVKYSSNKISITGEIDFWIGRYYTESDYNFNTSVKFNFPLNDDDVIEMFNGERRMYLTVNPYTRDTVNNMYFITEFKESSGLFKKESYFYIKISDVHSLTFPTLLTYFLHTEPDDIDLDIGFQNMSGSIEEDEITIPDPPSYSTPALHSIYVMNTADIQETTRALFSTDFATNIIKLVNDPMDYIVSLAISPIEPPSTDEKYNVVVGNMALAHTEDGVVHQITSKKLTNRFGQFSFGKIWLYANSYIDYQSTVEIYIPFIGTHTLNTHDVMGGILELKWNVDFFTGDFVAFLNVNNPMIGLNSVLYSWKGNFLSHVPITGTNYTQTLISGVSAIMSLSSGNIGGAISTMVGSLAPSISKTDNISGTTGMMGIYNAYITITRPVLSEPDKYDHLKGRPLNTSLTLYQGMGYIECEEIHINGIKATEEEISELETLFKNGVYL